MRHGWLCLGSGKHRALLTKCNDANLNQAHYVGLTPVPLVQVWQIDLPCVIHMLGNSDFHIISGTDITHWSMQGVCVQDPDAHRDVIVCTMVWDWNCAREAYELSLGSIIKNEVLKFGCETSVVCESIDYVFLASLMISVSASSHKR